jgi:hypothetical protein
MKQKLVIFLILVLLILILVGLNAATYVQKEKMPDTEIDANRSTYNSGTTGTQAFYALLSETGRQVIRWREPIDALLTEKKTVPGTFVVVGAVRREFTDTEVKQLLEWVSQGGRLVLIDREPPKGLMEGSSVWKISLSRQNEPELFGVDPGDQKQMTSGMAAAKPVQPTLFTKSVNAVQPSRFASAVAFQRNAEIYEDSKNDHSSPPPENADNMSVFQAPVVHLASREQNLLVDVPYGSGQIVFLSDPFIISNGGINMVDNAQLAINVVTPGYGTIAFEEYHHGYGSNNNRFLQFFAGTPVVAIFLQFAVLATFVLFSQSRRFARALPEKEPDRLSKLEYVSAMAELQQRTRAFDLAIESIYTDFHRRTAKLFGVDNTTIKRKDLAAMIAERIKADANEVDWIMFKCEDIIRGEPTNRKETLRLSARLRAIENQLGLQRSGAAKNT